MSDGSHQYTDKDVASIRDRIRIVQPVHDALRRWPEVSALAFESKSPGFLVDELSELLGIDSEQAQAVAEMQVVRASESERENVSAALDELRVELIRATDPRR